MDEFIFLFNTHVLSFSPYM